MEVLVFGGTTEGRMLVEWLAERGSCAIVTCTATDYGATLLPRSPRVTVLAGPQDDEGKRRLMQAHDFACIVDATHPYAQHISESIRCLAKEFRTPLLRIVRDAGGDGAWVSVPDARSAARHLAETSGRILLTTGSKDLACYTSILPSYAERLFIRVLPTVSALEHALGLGIPASHVVAMQGPFSAGLNEALIRELDIYHLVTKRSGAAGGFDEKVRAAAACGVELVVIERPREERGLSLDEAKAVLEERYGL